MRGSYFLLIFLLIYCSQPSDNKIVVPKLHAEFYSEALERINDELESSPDDQRLLDQKVFYCEQLNWPESCITALDASRELNGMTNQLVEQYIAYYQLHEQYQSLMEVIDRWGDEYDLNNKYKEIYIDCLTRLGKRAFAIIELKEYLKTHQDDSAFSFAANQYLRLKDTTLATYNLSKLYRLDPSNDLMWNYGNILVTLGYDEKGFDVMNHFVSNHSDDFDIQFRYALLLNKANRTRDARNVVKPFLLKDTVAYILADWYQKDLLWDSSRYVLGKVLEKDSSNRKPIWKLGRLYEDRGWFLASLPYFEYLLEMNPGDTLARQRIDLIQRKIAYLQRLKYEESKIPTIELQPNKIEN